MPIPESEMHYWGSIESEERAWRYISFPAFTKLMRNSKLLFRKITEYDDPFEGSIPQSFSELRERETENLDPYVDDAHEYYAEINRNARECLYANCWHLNDGESEAMWSKYGDKGIAIIADVFDIIPAFENRDEHLKTRPVRYLNFFKSFDELESTEQAQVQGAFDEVTIGLASLGFLKRDSFRHENEFRIIYPEFSYFPADEFEETNNLVVNGEETKYPVFMHRNGKPACVDFRKSPDARKKSLEVDISTLIEEIRVAPQADDWFFDTVCEVVDQIGPSALSSDMVEPSVTDVYDPAT